MEIPGKTALVLGAAKGIGKHIALALASAGAKVVLTYYDWPEESRQMREEFAALGHEHLAAKVDLRNAGEIAGLFDKIENRFGGLDILVINAGVGWDERPVEDSQLEAWRTTLEVNLLGAYYCAQAAIPALKQRGGGKIITIGSGVGHR